MKRLYKVLFNSKLTQLILRFQFNFKRNLFLENSDRVEKSVNSIKKKDYSLFSKMPAI